MLFFVKAIAIRNNHKNLLETWLDKRYSRKLKIVYICSAKDKLTINIRKDSYNGDVIKSITLSPGQTLEDIDVDIGGLSKVCIQSSIAINHGTIKKLVIGEPIFYNGTLKR